MFGSKGDSDRGRAIVFEESASHRGRPAPPAIAFPLTWTSARIANHGPTTGWTQRWVGAWSAASPATTASRWNGRYDKEDDDDGEEEDEGEVPKVSEMVPEMPVGYMACA